MRIVCQSLCDVNFVTCFPEQEDLLREMGHVASKPTPEVGLLRKQIEQLHLSLRTERSLADHTKLQLEQRMETEVSIRSSWNVVSVHLQCYFIIWAGGDFTFRFTPKMLWKIF